MAVSRNISTLPAPSANHATCAWCRRDFARITDLLAHVENGHAK